MESKSANKLPLTLTDRLKINSYAYLLSFMDLNNEKANEYVKSYEKNIYNNRLHQYCEKESRDYRIYRGWGKYDNDIDDYVICLQVHEWKNK